MKTALLPTLRIFCFTILCLLWTIILSAQAEVFVNQASGQPLTAGTTFLVEDDKFSQPDKEAAIDDVRYVDNRLLLQLISTNDEPIPPGVYRVLAEIRYWSKGEDGAKAAPNGVLRELVIEVAEKQQGLPKTSLAFTGGRKLEIEVKNVSFNDGPMPEGAPEMKLTGEIATQRSFCALNLSYNTDPVTLQDLPAYRRVVDVPLIPCVDEYDLEYVFFDRDSEVGQQMTTIIGGGSAPTLWLNPLFAHNASRLTSTSNFFRFFDFYRDGFVIARYRGVQYDVNGLRRYTKWSTLGKTFTDYLDHYATVSHQDDLNWQITNNFAEEAKQLPSISYLDGTMRGRQNMVLQYGENNGVPNPGSEYAIAQQSIYDGMGRPAISTLPAPLYPEEVSETHPLVFTTEALPRNGLAQLYGTTQVEAPSCTGEAPQMGAAAGAGKYYSKSNERLDENAFVPDAEWYPYAVTRFTPDNTGRIRQQGGVGQTLRAGAGHDTKYYYGDVDQWELDRLFGINVGNAEHYEKRMVIDPNGQASLSYVDAKGRTVATALAGEKPDNLAGLASYPAAQKMSPVEVNILRNERGTSSITSSYSITVEAENRYDLCYALGETRFNNGCCGEDVPDDRGDTEVDRSAKVSLAQDCPTCTYDVTITLNGDCDWNDGEPLVIEYEGIQEVGDINDCLGGADDQLTDLLLPIGEYHLTKHLTINEEARAAALEDYLNNADCVTTEETFITSITSQIDYDSCEPCDCSPRNDGGSSFARQAGQDNGEPNDICAEMCARFTPCEARYRLMAGDLIPGGQYATYEIREDYEYQADDNPLSIFFATTNTDPYYQTIPYGGNTVTIGDNEKEPGELTVRQFVENFSDDWVPFLISYHPENCLLEQCFDQLDRPVEEDEYNSNSWDKLMRESSSYAAAEENGIFPLGSRFSRFVNQFQSDGYDALESMVDRDPYFIDNPQYASAFLNLLTAGENDPDEDDPNNILQAMHRSMFDIFGDNNPSNLINRWEWGQVTTDTYYQYNTAWRIIRDLYLGRKTLFIEEILVAYCQVNDHDIHGQGWQCLQRPYCADYSCADPTVNCNNTDNQEYSEFTARVFLLSLTDAFSALQTNATQTAVGTQAGTLALDVLQDCKRGCDDNRSLWREEIEACEQFNNATIEEILDEFELICKAGCADQRLFGSSALADDTNADLEFTSFEAVLTHYLQQQPAPADACTTCNPYLINYPPPSDMDLYASTLIVPGEQIASWLHLHRTFLSNRRDYYSRLCSCGREGEDYRICAQEDMAYFNDLDLSVVARAWSAIENFLNNNDIPSESQSLIIPAEFNPQGNYCKTRAEINDLLDEMAVDCGLDQQYESLDLMTDFLNSRLGWDRSAADYGKIIEGIGEDDKACLICDKPFPEDFDSPRTACREELLSSAITQALLYYEQYREETAAGFVKRYTEECLSGANEAMYKHYTPFQHHYTLYYYDQADNLLMTVPPEGVTPIPGTSMPVAIQAYREGLNNSEPTTTPNYPAILPKHNLLTDYRYNNFGEIAESDSPDKSPARTWYDALGRVVLSQDGRQSDASSSQDGLLYSYTFYDELGRITEVGEFRWPWTETGLIDLAEGGEIKGAVNAGTERRYVTKTYYTEGLDIPAIEQDNLTLRNRVAAVTFEDTENNDEDDYEFASHYAYDIAGNVATMVQEFRELEDIGHQYKKIEYDYDLISGNVHGVFYQRGQDDQFTYRYEYDKTNRLVSVFTSATETEHSNSGNWLRDATYDYFDYGPLKRMVIGQDRLQGVDYAYTIQGWIKGINGGFGTRRNSTMMHFDLGQDGPWLNSNGFGATDPVAFRDLYRYANSYFEGDYRPICRNEIGPGDPFYIANNRADLLYNGNISSHLTLTPEDSYATGFLNADYDQLHRIVGSLQQALGHSDPQSTALYESLNKTKAFYTYDGNGNILTLKRSFGRWQAPAAWGGNDLTYSYLPGSNRLAGVTQTITGNNNPDNRPFDFINQDQGYVYDGAGNLVDHTDGTGSLGRLEATLDWTPYGKVKSVNTETPQVIDDESRTVTYGYGPDQNRWVKANHRDFGRLGTLTDAEYQVRDAQGNTLATYYRGTTTDGDGRITSTPFTWRQQYLYGSGRLGQVSFERELPDVCVQGPGDPPCPISDDPIPPGTRRYELSNHLGNVTTVFGERTEQRQELIGDLTRVYWTPELHRFTDYLPFGLELARTPTDAGSGGTNGDFSYRYGFNGKERDDDGEWGSLNHYDYGFRIYNPGIAKFLSVDPLAPEYPWYTPYQFAGNKPVEAIDLDGLEELRINRSNSGIAFITFKKGTSRKEDFKVLIDGDNYLKVSEDSELMKRISLINDNVAFAKRFTGETVPYINNDAPKEVVDNPNFNLDNYSIPRSDFLNLYELMPGDIEYISTDPLPKITGVPSSNTPNIRQITITVPTVELQNIQVSNGVSTTTNTQMGGAVANTSIATWNSYGQGGQSQLVNSRAQVVFGRPGFNPNTLNVTITGPPAYTGPQRQAFLLAGAQPSQITIINDANRADFQALFSTTNLVTTPRFRTVQILRQTGTKQVTLDIELKE